MIKILFFLRRFLFVQLREQLLAQRFKTVMRNRSPKYRLSSKFDPWWLYYQRCRWYLIRPFCVVEALFLLEKWKIRNHDEVCQVRKFDDKPYPFILHVRTFHLFIEFSQVYDRTANVESSMLRWRNWALKLNWFDLWKLHYWRVPDAMPKHKMACLM